MMEDPAFHAGPARFPVARPPGDRVHPACLLAETLTTLKRLGVTERHVFDEILRSTLANHPECLGFWSVWEPDALDGRDRDYVNRPGHDATGRYIPFWNRGSGAITVEPNLFYETPGIGEFYLRPRREGRPCVIEPYEYPVAGRPRLICSQVAPIFTAGRCVGAAGLDVALDAIPRAASAADDDNPLEDLLGFGFVFLRDARASAAVSYCSPRSRQLLTRYAGPAFEGQLPRRLSRALEQATRVSFRAGPAELVVERFEHPFCGPGLWLRERSCSSERCPRLSAREGEVLDWLSEGKTNPEIAAILGISVHTVKRHVERVLQKLGVPNRSAAATARAAIERPRPISRALSRPSA
jgi:DNA-binding CsgD family transcriptional regulator